MSFFYFLPVHLSAERKAIDKSTLQFDFNECKIKFLNAFDLINVRKLYPCNSAPELYISICHCSVLDPLLKTELAVVPDQYFPLSSLGPRERRVSMATYLLSQLRIALNMDTETFTDHCHCVIIKGGNIRGERSL